MIRSIVVTLLLAAPLVACGTADTADTVDDASSTSAPTTAPTPTGGIPSTSADSTERMVVPLDVAPCSLLTADEVGMATGLPAAAGVEDGPISCSFELTGTTVSVFVSVEDGEGRIAGGASLHEAYSSGGGEVVDGLGESAVYSSAFRAIAVDAGGGRFYAVGLNGGYPPELDDPKDVLVGLATLALARI